MASVTLQIIVEGKNVKVIQKDVENLANSTNKAGKALDKAGESINTTDRRLKGTAKASSSATKNFSKQAQGISVGLVPAYATLAANIFAVTAAFRFLRSAGDLQVLQRGQEAYASATGTALRTLSADIIAATDAQIKFTDASQAAAIGVAAGLSPEQLVKLGTAARDVSVILGRDVTDSFNRLIRGVTKAEPELLDELGIVLRLKDATEKYATVLGKNANELTAYERSQAVANDVLTQAEDKYGRILAVIEPQVNEFNKLAIAFDNLFNKIRTFTSYVAGPFAQAITQFPALGVALLGIFGTNVLKAALPGLRNLKEGAIEAAEASAASFKKAERNLEAYNLRVERAAKAAQKRKNLEPAGILQSSFTRNDPGFSGDTFRAIRQGRANELSQSNLASAISVIKRSKKIPQELKDAWIYELKIIETSTRKTSAEIVKEFRTIPQRIGVSLASIRASWAGMLASMRAAMVTFASYVSIALSALGWISLIATLGVTVYQFFKARDAADETSQALDYQAKKIQSLNEEFKDFNAIQNIITEDGKGMLQYFTALGTRIGQLNLSSLSETFNNIPFDSSAIDAFVAKSEKTLNRLSGSGSFFGKILGGSEITRLERQIQGVTRTLEIETRPAAIAILQENLAKLNEELAAVNSEVEAAQSNFGNFLNASEDQRLKQLGQYFTDQAAALETINTNFSGAGSTAIIDYLQKIDELLKSPTDETIVKALIADLTRLQPEVTKVTSLFNNYSKSVEDNKRLVDQISTSFLQPSQEAQAIVQLETEIDQTEQLREQMRGLTKEQEDRLKVAIESLRFVTLLNNAEQDRVNREAAISIERERSIRGLTKFQSDLTSRALDQIKIESDRQFLLDQQELVYRKIKDSNGKVGVAEGQRLISLQLQLDLLKEQEESLKRQGDYAAQLSDTINDSFEAGFASGLEKLINNTEGSLKESIRTLALDVLNSIAGTLARQITENITKVKFTERLRSTFEYGAATLHSAITSALNTPLNSKIVEKTDESPALSGDPVLDSIRGATERTAKAAEENKGIFTSIKELLIGIKVPTSVTFSEVSEPQTVNTEVNVDTPQIRSVNVEPETPNTVLKGGIFSSFINSLKDIFNPNVPFIEKLSGLFLGVTDIFKNTFTKIFTLFGQGGGILGTLLGSVPFLPFANGGVMRGGMQAYATGGIATRPTVGIIGEGRLNEAVVPLPNGTDIPVKLQGNTSSQQNNITVNVESNGKTTTTGDAPQLNNIGNAIARAVQQELQKQKRSGGILSPYGVA